MSSQLLRSTVMVAQIVGAQSHNYLEYVSGEETHEIGLDSPFIEFIWPALSSAGSTKCAER